jgi:eukaryotic-like serine/threonine-protein kinase
LIGRVFDDRYEILRKLGTGGMAEVYLAHDRHLDRDVALKVLLSKYAEDPQFIERFRREASAAASLNHPNIVQIYDRGEGEGTYYIAMEYLDGRSLKEIILRYGPLRADHVVSIAGQILEALRFAHRKDVIHRDIKPQNIMVDDEGRVKVTDFGIARAGSASAMTETGSILGTAHYLSPEQAQGGQVEAGSDLYSLGVVMYEMVTGALPFTGDNPVAIAMQHVHEAPVPPRSLTPAVPENLENVILRALAKDPSQRYLTAQAFLDDLKLVKEGQEVTLPPDFGDQETRLMAALESADPTQVRRSGSAAPANRPRETAPRRRRSAWPWILVLLFVVVLGGGAYGLMTILDTGGQGAIEIPNLAGKTLQQAKDQLDPLGLKVAEGGAAESSTKYAKGQVIRQDPGSGKRANKGDTVKVWLSSGPNTVKVPNLVDGTQAEAESTVAELKLTLDPHQEASPDKPVGTVTRQDPAAGKEVSAGSTVSIWVSSGPSNPNVSVPRLIGMQQDMASTMLSSLKLVPNIQPVASDKPGGEVVDQSPKEGVTVAVGSMVTVMVSNSPLTPKISVPSLINVPIDQAKNALQVRGLTWSITEKPEAAWTPNHVMAQSPSGGTEVDKGSVVYLTVAITTTTTAPPTTTTATPSTTTTTAPPPTTTTTGSPPAT